MLREQGKDRKREREGERELIKEDRCQVLAEKRGGRRANKGEDEGNEGVEGIGR